MLDVILSLIPGGSLTAILGGLVALGGIVIAAFRRGRKSERNANRAKEADAYEKHLQDIAGANHARNSVSPDGVPEHDKYRRD